VAVVLATGANAVATEDRAQPVIEAIHDALDAWSEFARTGDLAATGEAFAPTGPQARQFEVESDTQQDSAAPSLRVLDLRLRRLNEAIATVWAEVEVSQAGFRSQVFGWDFDLISKNGRWLVWTVVPAETPPTSLTEETAPTLTVAEPTSQTPPAPVISAGPIRADAAPATPDAGSSDGIRMPALSAWIIVVTLVGVALAGYMAPRIDRRRGE
jgi:hypothetical protein